MNPNRLAIVKAPPVKIRIVLEVTESELPWLRSLQAVGVPHEVIMRVVLPMARQSG